MVRQERRQAAIVVGPPRGPGDTGEVRDADALRALFDPFRTELLRLLAEPRTVKELADEVGRPHTSLYYHVNQLVDLGLVGVAAEEVVGRSLERRFTRTASTFTTAPALSDVVAHVAPSAGVADDVEQLLQTVLGAEPDDVASDDPVVRVGMAAEVSLTPVEAQALGDRLRDLAGGTQLSEDGATRRRYRLVIALGPAPASNDEEQR